MTKDDVIRLAKEAEMPYNYRSGEINNLNPLERFANLVAAHERARNTKLLYQMHERAAAQHNYYLHAAIEISRKAETVNGGQS